MGSVITRTATRTTYSSSMCGTLQIVPLATKEFLASCHALNIKDPKTTMRNGDRPHSWAWYGRGIWLQTSDRSYLVGKYGFDDCAYVKNHNICTAGPTIFAGQYVPMYLYSCKELINDLRCTMKSDIRCVITEPIEYNTDHCQTIEISTAPLPNTPLEFLLGSSLWLRTTS